jgi:hypothetical protein
VRAPEFVERYGLIANHLSRIKEKRRTIVIAPEVASTYREAFRPVAARSQVPRIVDLSSSVVDDNSNVGQDDVAGHAQGGVNEDPEWLGDLDSLHPGMYKSYIQD